MPITLVTIVIFFNRCRPFCKMAATATPTIKFEANKWIRVLIDMLYEVHITIFPPSWVKDIYSQSNLPPDRGKLFLNFCYFSSFLLFLSKIIDETLQFLPKL